MIQGSEGVVAEMAACWKRRGARMASWKKGVVADVAPFEEDAKL